RSAMMPGGPGGAASFGPPGGSGFTMPAGPGGPTGMMPYGRGDGGQGPGAYGDRGPRGDRGPGANGDRRAGGGRGPRRRRGRGGGAGRAAVASAGRALDPVATADRAADDAVDRDKTELENERARDGSRGPARFSSPIAHFLLFSYSSTYFFGLALNSSRHPVQQ